MYSHNLGRSCFYIRLKSPLFIFCSIWSLGVISGVYIFCTTPLTALSLIRSSVIMPISFIGLIFAQTIPLLITYLACLLSKPLLIYPVAFMKAFSYGLCTFGIAVTFGDAGWLVRLLILFPDFCIVCVLIWFWIRRLTNSEVSFGNDLIVSLLAIFIICIIYFFSVLPILSHLAIF